MHAHYTLVFGGSFRSADTVASSQKKSKDRDKMLCNLKREKLAIE